jgi:HAD superfamily hydrolase (TIGR01509 family)
MNKPDLQALIFDVDGTLADTELAHLAAFNSAFEQEGLPWRWDVPLYTELLDVSGGKERITHYWRQVQPDLKIIDNAAFTDTVQRIHDQKTAVYERMVGDGSVQLRPGVLKLIEQAHDAGLQLAIATTTSPVNISALLRTAIGLGWSQFFVVIEDASTAPRKKPHPQVYLQTLDRLKLPASACLAIEDSANGLRSALAAGLQTIITKNSFTEHHDFSGALAVLSDLAGCNLQKLASLHAARPAPLTGH